MGSVVGDVKPEMVKPIWPEPVIPLTEIMSVEPLTRPQVPLKLTKELQTRLLMVNDFAMATRYSVGVVDWLGVMDIIRD